MKKLISMTDYVLEQNIKHNGEYQGEEMVALLIQLYSNIMSYANFLEKPLTLGMFIPTDENGNILDEDGTDGEGYILDKIMHDEFQQAKDRVIFYGFEWKTANWCDEPMLEIFNKNDNCLVYDCEDKNFQDADELFFETIEDLVKYNLTITETAVKKQGL